MSQIFKVGLSIFLTLIMVMGGAGLILASKDANEAEQYVSDVVSAIEQSNYSKVVLSSCVAQAQTKGYELTIEEKDMDGNKGTDMAEVVLKYQYHIRFLNVIGETHTVRAYAR